MLNVCASVAVPPAWTTNQFPLSRAVMVALAAASCQVIEDVVLLSVPPFCCTTNWGSVLVAGGTAVGFRQGGRTLQ